MDRSLKVLLKNLSVVFFCGGLFWKGGVGGGFVFFKEADGAADEGAAGEGGEHFRG